MRSLVLLLMAAASPALAADCPNEKPVSEERVAVLVHSTAHVAALLEVAACHFLEVAVPTRLEVERLQQTAERARAGEIAKKKPFGYDRLITVDVDADGPLRTVRVSSTSIDGVTDLRSAEATEASVPAVFRSVLADLPRRRAGIDRWLRVRKPERDEAAFLHAALFGGRKQLDESEWGPLSPQNELGLNLTGGGARWPVHVAADWYASLGSHEPTDSSATLMEFGLGARRILDLGVVRPSLGAGVAVSTIRIVQDPDPETPDAITGRGFGPWVDAGVTFRFLKWWDVGVKVRWSQAEAELEPGGGTLGAGGLHYGVTIGTGS